MLAKLWCDHAEGFESGLRAWELDVGEWRTASGTALADAAKVHSDEMLILGTYWKTRYSMVSEQTCTIDYKMDQGM